MSTSYMHAIGRSLLSLLLLLLLAGCGGSAPAASTDQQTFGNTAAQAEGASGSNDNSGESGPPAPPTPTEPPPPTPTPPVGPLPKGTVTADTELLLFQPGGNALNGQPIPANTEVMMMGKNEPGALREDWYRVRYGQDVGWVRGNATSYPSRKLATRRVPPQCANGTQAVHGLDAVWTSTFEGELVVVVDLYRGAPGSLGNPRFDVLLNDTPLADKTRVIKTTGAILLPGTAIPVGHVKQGDRIAFRLDGAPTESIQLFAAFFQVPDGCTFKEG